MKKLSGLIIGTMVFTISNNIFAEDVDSSVPAVRVCNTDLEVIHVTGISRSGSGDRRDKKLTDGECTDMGYSDESPIRIGAAPDTKDDAIYIVTSGFAPSGAYALKYTLSPKQPQKYGEYYCEIEDEDESSYVFCSNGWRPDNLK